MGYFERIGWSPMIGDPSFFGWLTVFAYAYTAMLSFKVVGFSRTLFSNNTGAQRNLWVFIFLAFVFFAINKQLDLQTLFLRSLKYLAEEQGWYERRRALQVIFIKSILVFAVLFLIGLVVIFWRHLKSHLCAFIGLSFLTGFILIRAASFHNMDILIRTGIDVGIVNFNINHIFELAGIGLVFINAKKLLAENQS